MLLVPCVLVVLACTRGGPPPAARGADVPAADSLRGMVDIVGSEPGTWVVLRMEGGSRAVTLAGDRAVLDRLAGLEVAVWGAAEGPGTFRVSRLAVRAASGMPAVDGILVREGQGFVLVTAAGRRLPIAHLPHDLRASVGARVWLAGPLDRAPDSFGVIGDPR